MTVKKIDIIKNIISEIGLTHKDSRDIFEKFTDLIKSESRKKDIKISNFGTFSYVRTPKRIGRDPKTKKTYIIRPRKKLALRASSKVKRRLN
tara:strand:+ start:1991 stop:2266 length:276 start_codon:yes stop_codon:yes gene_type:complete